MAQAVEGFCPVYDKRLRKAREAANRHGPNRETNAEARRVLRKLIKKGRPGRVDATQSGCVALAGRAMLLEQGLAQFEPLTGRAPPSDVMAAAMG